ncbi:MAG TPA: hypothetical protein VJR27_01335 [Candidatus Saccharimonadales bacterium]|nr:hypothetical protein [Candidatus Saccharimonadales bacterium]
MTNEQLLEDLKQFIAVTVSQSEKRLRADMATKDDLVQVVARLDTIQDAVADALTQTNEALDATVQDHEHRITRLEHRAA